jgi:hypothetical protein
MQLFNIEATLDDKGLLAVSQWFDHYGGLLLHHKPRSTETLWAFVNYTPPWSGRHIGVNVAWDIGIYVGQCIIARRSFARWDLDTGDPDPLSRQGLGFQRPHLEGLSWPPFRDPITQVFTTSRSMGSRVRFGARPPLLPTSLFDLVRLWSSSTTASSIK